MSWGNGHFGQLGHGLDHVVCDAPMVVERLLGRAVGGDVVRVEAGGMHSAAIVDMGGSGGGVMGAQPSFWNRRCGEGVHKGGRVNVNNTHAGIQTRVFHWGSNRYGQCAIEGGKSNAVGFPLPMIDVHHPETRKKISFVSLALGRRHSVGLSLSSPGNGAGGVGGGELYSWGSTASGRCGHGNLGSSSKSRATSVGLPRRIDALRNVNVVQVDAGDSHTLALCDNGRVFS